MQQANKLLLLSEVPPHIHAEMESSGTAIKIVFRHRDHQPRANRLQINIEKAGKEFCLSYESILDCDRQTQSRSTPFPAKLLRSFISQIATDVFPA